MTFIPTQEQIKQAQECGNAAAAMCTKPIDQAIAYRKMYDITINRYEAEAQRQYTTSPAVTLLDAAPLADAQAAKFEAHVAGLSAEDVAEMEAMCEEQRIDRDTNAGMCN